MSAARVAGLQVTDRPIVRHVEFNGNSQSKMLSNSINREGTYMPNACAPCLKALMNYDKTHIVGRGVKTHNEYFSCLSSKKYGNGGTQCARCVGLGNAESCLPPDASLYREAREIIRLAPAYNQILDAHPTTIFEHLSEDDQVVIEDIISASQTFSLMMKGGHRAGTLETPAKKRRLAEHDTTISEIQHNNEMITMVGTSTRSELATVGKTLEALTTSIQRLDTKLDRLDQMATISRERTRWTVTAVGALVAQGNSTAAAVNSLLPPPPPPVIDPDDPAAEVEPVPPPQPYTITETALWKPQLDLRHHSFIDEADLLPDEDDE